MKYDYYEPTYTSNFINDKWGYQYVISFREVCGYSTAHDACAH